MTAAVPPPTFRAALRRRRCSRRCAVFTWTGFYAGFNAGYGFDASSSSAARPSSASRRRTPVRRRQHPQSASLAFSNTNNNEGFVGGGQIGYNYQFTPGSGVVVGIEADAQYADFAASGTASRPPARRLGPHPGHLVYNPNGLSGLDYFGTVRGRLGYAFDRTLVYATGGFAYGSGGGRQFGTGVSSDDFQTGYAVGGGVEYALPTDSFLNFFRSSAVTLKVEGLYVNLEQNRRTAGAFATNNLAPSSPPLPRA